MTDGECGLVIGQFYGGRVFFHVPHSVPVRVHKHDQSRGRIPPRLAWKHGKTPKQQCEWHYVMQFCEGPKSLSTFRRTSEAERA
jgi:hypothetical protein